jgi:hypothetical protein
MNEALAQGRKKRSSFFPNLNFQSQLRMFENALKGNKEVEVGAA